MPFAVIGSIDFVERDGEKIRVRRHVDNGIDVEG